MPSNHKKCRPRLEERVLLPPRRCLAAAAKQLWDHCPPFRPLAPLSATTGLWAEQDVPKSRAQPGEQDILPRCAGQAWSCLTAPCPPRGLCSLKTKPCSHTPGSQSARALLGLGERYEESSYKGSPAPTRLGAGGEGGEEGPDKVQSSKNS